MGAFDDPASGAKAGLTGERLLLLAARANVRAETELAGELLDLVVVVSRVEAQTLWTLPGRLRPLIGIDSSVGRASRWSLRLAPASAIPIGMPPPSVRSDRFAPF